MELKDWMILVNYRITEGSEFGWSCFGANAFTLSCWNGDQDGWSTNATFDTRSQEVYILEVCDYQRQRAYRYINPAYRETYASFVKRSDFEDTAWDSVNWVDLEVETDWFVKASAIVNNEPYDTRVSIPIDLDRDELYDLMMRAHEADVTLNQFVENILQRVIDRDLAVRAT